MTGARRAVRLTAGLGLFLSLEACSTRFQIPRPSPLPTHEHLVLMPMDVAWKASLAALAARGFAPVETDAARGVIVTEFQALDGNTTRQRTDGIARLAVERDLYATGRARIALQLIPAGGDQTRILIAAQLEAKVTRFGEVQYAEVSGGRSSLPLFTAWTTARAGMEGDDWQTLTSNGVLEDEFLAAFVAELADAALLGEGS